MAVIGGLVLVLRGGDGMVSIGLLMLTGVVVGAVPTIIGGSDNRYFFVPLPPWAAAVMVALDPLARRSRPWMVGVVLVIVTPVWWLALPASWFRTIPAPPNLLCTVVVGKWLGS